MHRETKQNSKRWHASKERIGCQNKRRDQDQSSMEQSEREAVVEFAYSSRSVKHAEIVEGHASREGV